MNIRKLRSYFLVSVVCLVSSLTTAGANSLCLIEMSREITGAHCVGGPLGDCCVTTVRHHSGKTASAKAALRAGVGIVNADFADGLTGWTPTVRGGDTSPGEIFVENEQAVLLEGDSFLITLEQSFEVSGGLQDLSFDVILAPGFDLADGFMPDAFEAQLLDETGASVVLTWDPDATSFFNVQEDLSENLGPGVTFDGQTVTLDVSGVPAGTVVTLYFDLIGADADTESGVRIDNITLVGGNEPPVCSAGEPYEIECAGLETSVSLDGGGSTDPDPDDTLSYAWTTDCPGAAFDDAALPTPFLTLFTQCPDLPMCNVTLTVTDLAGASATCSSTVTVDDTTDPEITVDTTPITVTDIDCSGDETVELPTATGTDACGDVSIMDDAPTSFPAGETTSVTYTATDDCQNSSSEAVDVTVLYGADIFVTAKRHVVQSGTHPGSIREPLVGIDVCGYDKSEGSCSREACGGISHQHYECIALGEDTDGDGSPDIGPCEPTNCCTTDENGECTINLPPGDYIVISADATKTVLPDPLGVSASDLLCGELEQKHLQQIVRDNGRSSSGATTYVQGQSLLIIRPDFVVWDQDLQPYPFLFEGDDEWDVSVSMAPPAGFRADQDMLDARLVDGDGAVQFTIRDEGGPVGPTTVTIEASKGGRVETVESRIDVYLTEAYARSQGRDVDTLEGEDLIKDTDPPTQDTDGDSLVPSGTMCGAAGSGCGPTGPSLAMIALALLSLRFVGPRRSRRRL